MVSGGATLANVVTVYGGSRTTCALGADSKVSCWGTNGHLQGGYGGGGNLQQANPVSSPSSESGGLDGLIAVSSGETVSCGFRGNGSVLCWGNNANGELAISNLTTITEVPQFSTFPLM